MKHYFIPTLLTAIGCTASAFSAEHSLPFGIFNFGACANDSKLGKQEQASLESLKKQMSSLLEETEKQLNELATKFNDPEYLDGLSPEAEEELNQKFRSLNEELNRYQNQYYQVMNQAQMRVMHTLTTSINNASKKVAEDQKLIMIVNKDACSYGSSEYDMSHLIVAEMDKNFAQEAKKSALSQAAVEQSAHPKNDNEAEEVHTR
jgi:outer membrane protein